MVTKYIVEVRKLAKDRADSALTDCVRAQQLRVPVSHDPRATRSLAAARIGKAKAKTAAARGKIMLFEESFHKGGSVLTWSTPLAQAPALYMSRLRYLLGLRAG